MRIRNQCEFILYLYVRIARAFRPMTPPPFPSHPGIVARQTGHLGREYFNMSRHSTLLENLPRSGSFWCRHRVRSLHRGFDRNKKTKTATNVATRRQRCVAGRRKTDRTRITPEEFFLWFPRFRFYVK